MLERRKSEKKVRLIPPSEEEIDGYLFEVQNKVKVPYKVKVPFAEEEIRPDTENVRIVTEDGIFLGWGDVGSYDWFYLKKKPNGRSVDHYSLHHRNSSLKFNMTMVDDPINIETDEIKKLLDESSRL